MIRNYILTALAVLKRKKFFTFISLFGISFTLTIIIVVAAFLNQVLRAGYPDVNRDRTLYINNISSRNTKLGFHMNSSPSYYFLEHYTSLIRRPVKVAISSLPIPTNAFINNKKLKINLKYTNASFWDVLQYQFLQGKPFDKQMVDNGTPAAVITEETREAYFGSDTQIIGKYLETDNTRFRVVGVVRNIPITMPYAYSDIFVPYTLSRADLHDHSLYGNYAGEILPVNPADKEEVKNEFKSIVAQIPIPNKDFDEMFANADTYLESFTRIMLGNINNSGSGTLFMILGIIVFLFLLLPTLNLVNINISRILERSSEIAVRKAYGASSKTLVIQFIAENMILTLIGGFVGVALSLLLIAEINSLALISYVKFTLDIKVICYSLFICLFFGLLSGVYPAWRMAKLQVTDALKYR